MKSHDIPSIRAKNKKNRVLACGHPPTPSCGATGLPQGPTRRWQRREKRSQNEAKVRGRTGHWEAGLLRKRPVFTGDFGVWRGLRHRPAGGEKIQNEATANAMDGRRQGRCGTPMGAVTEMCEKANDTNEIKPNKTMKDLATDDTEIVLSLWAAVAGESGVAAPALPPQSITRWVGRAVRGTRVSQAWAVPQSACSAGIQGRSATLPTFLFRCENPSKFDRIQVNPTKKLWKQR